jgi:peptidoglycan L-alanyl-D-glutamate endopeptidase CwlK
MMNEHVKKVQQDLGLVDDGVRGRITDAAVLKAVDTGRVIIRPAPEPVIIKTPSAEDDIPETGRAKLAGVNPVLQAIFLQASAECDVPFTCIEGLRTAERQRQLVAAGASKTQNSRHLTGHAGDLWPLDPATGKPLPSDAAFPKGSAAAKAAAARLWADLRIIAAVVKRVAAARGVQIEWGGDWGWDAPHFQLSRAQYPA